jgi:hypothetical protein
MRAGKFSSSLVFAAVFGLAAVPYLLVALPAFGLIRTVAIGSIVSVFAYIVVASPSLVRGLRYGALTLVLGVGLYALAPAVVVPFASAALLGIVRSGLLYRTKSGRGLAIEGMLFLLATSVAQLLAGSTVQSYGLAVWGFFLVESAFFLFEGASPRTEPEPAEDHFERARREATRLMEEQPG